MEEAIKRMNKAIELYGLESKEALIASQEVDKHIVKSQMKLYTEYKQKIYEESKWES